MLSPAYAVFNFLGIFFILLPAGWHWSARNTATLLFIFWCLVSVVPAAINSVVWYDRVDIKAPIYCDVRFPSLPFQPSFSPSPPRPTIFPLTLLILRGADVCLQIVTKLRIGGDVGVPAALLCITRQLEAIAAARQAYFSAKDRQQRRLVGLAIGLGIPILIMVLHTVVQGHRYDIIERVGCIPSVYWSLPAVFLVIIWPVVLLLAAAVYGGTCSQLAQRE